MAKRWLTYYILICFVIEVSLVTISTYKSSMDLLPVFPFLAIFDCVILITLHKK